MGSKNKDYRKISSFIFRIAVSLAIILYLASTLDWHLLADLFHTLNYAYILVAFLLFGLAILAASIRWLCLLSIQRMPFTTYQISRITLTGIFFNTFLPGSTGGDLVRLLYIFAHYPCKKSAATLSIIMDRFLGLGALLLLTVFAIMANIDLFTESSQAQPIIQGIFISAAILCLTLIFISTSPVKWLPLGLKNFFRSVPAYNFIAQIFETFQHFFQKPGKILFSFSLALFVQLMMFSSAFMLSKAFSMQIAFLDMAIIIAVVTCIISLPISISGHGLREGAFLFMFGLLFSAGNIDARYDNEVVVLFSFMFFLLMFVWGLIGGVIYLFFEPDKLNIMKRGFYGNNAK